MTIYGGATLRILVVNDDGVHSRGVWALTEELAKFAEVHVVVPDREQSGIGTAITLHRPLRTHKLTWQGVESAHSVDGTPADCTILGLRSIVKEPVDLVVAGINEGANLGNDTLISGTVGAALQGFFYGVPSIAASVTSVERPIFETAASFTALLAKELLSRESYEKIFFNINVPNRPLEQIKGVCITNPAKRSYMDLVEEKTDTRGKGYYWILRGTPEWAVDEGTDIWALRNRFISINQLHTGLMNTSREDSFLEICEQAFEGVRANLAGS